MRGRKGSGRGRESGMREGEVEESKVEGEEKVE